MMHNLIIKSMEHLIVFFNIHNDDDFVGFDAVFPISSIVTLEFIAIILRLFQSLGEFNRVLSMSISTYVHLENLLKIEENKETIYSSNFQIEDSINERKML